VRLVGTVRGVDRARARVVRPSPRGFVVEDAGGVVRDVPRSAVRQVLRLLSRPWISTTRWYK
jgi:hypothetical protein